MPQAPSTWFDWLQQHNELLTLGSVALLLFAAWLGNWLVKRILVRGLCHLIDATTLGRNAQDLDNQLIRRLANVVPALLIIAGIGFIPDLPESLVSVTRNVCSAFIVLTVALALSLLLDIANTLYNLRHDAHLRPIKGYLQVLKISVFAVATILMIATLIDRSPLILLSGLGAMAAVLMLIFQDTLLSLVASVQITSSDIIRVGDWVEMPQLNADGDVVDIALHTVKVQNWDKTISSIPTRRFITDPFKNWRGMQECGGRRIMRSLYLDQTSIGFLSPNEIAHLQNVDLLGQYLTLKHSELETWNNTAGDTTQLPINTRRLTNIGTFRAYVEHYLRQHPHIHQDMTQLVRQLSPTADGLPMQIYCFTNTIVWSRYESIQADIFDHLLAILPEFGLRVFQHPSGVDIRELGRSRSTQSTPA